MADLERLTVLIEANTRQITRQLKTLERDIDRSMRTSARSVNTLNKSLAVATTAAKAFAAAFVAGSLAQLPGAIRDMVKSVADLGDQADRIGITAEQLQELNFQAEQTGAAAGAMADGLQMFAKRLAEARTGSGELYKLLQANGLALDDIAKMSVNEALRVFVDLLGNATDEADKLKIATIGLGKGGADLALTFAGGSQAMLEFALQARAASAVISNDLVKSAQDIDDEFAQLTTTISTMIKAGLLEFIETTKDEISALQGVLEDLRRSAQQGAEEAGARAGKLIAGGTPQASDVANQRINQAFEVAGIDDARRRLRRTVIPASGGGGTTGSSPKAKVEEVKKAVAETDDAAEQLISTLDDLRYSAGSALDAFVQSIANAEGPLEAMKAALVDILQTIIRIAEQQAIARLFGATGTAGGGILGSLAGAAVAAVAPRIGSVAPARAASSEAVSVNVTATPSPLLNLTITKSSQAAEERAIARGPVMARNNSLRYAVP